MNAGSHRSGNMHRFVLLGLFLVGAVIFWRLWDLGLLAPEAVQRMVGAHAVSAPFLFIGAYALAVLFMVPTLPLNLGAGFLWGPLLGGIYSLLGSTIGSVAAFLFARTAFGQPMARRFRARIFQSLANMLERGGWKVVAFTRLNPAVPTSVVNFLFGLTSLSLWTYAWASLVFFFPLCYLFAYLGYSTGGFMLNGDINRLVRIIAVSLGFGLFLAAGKHLLTRGRNGNGGKTDAASSDESDDRPQV